jgi:1-acyl-sn-glycerol-3-phosphate acyltransferase
LEATADEQSGTERGERECGGDGRGDDGARIEGARGDEETILAEMSSFLDDLYPGRAEDHRDSARRRIAIGLDTDLGPELGVDSLALVELYDRVERAFGVRLPDDVLARARTPRDWLRAVRDSRQGATGGGGAGTTTVPASPAPSRPTGPPSVPAPAERGAARRASTLTEALAWHAAEHPSKVTIRLLPASGKGAAEELTYAALAAQAATAGAGLLASGLRPGERVAIMLPTSSDYFACFLGILLAGGVPVPIYPPARLSVLEQHLQRQALVLENAGAALIVTVPEARLAATLLRARVGSLREVCTPESLSRAGSGRPAPRHTVRADDLALIQYTSGSTGDPKGVVLSHAQILADVAAMGDAAAVTAADSFVSWLPLYHDMGLIAAWHAPMVLGIPLVVMSPLSFLARPSRWLRAISTYRGTISAGPDFAYRACTERIADDELEGVDLSCWRIAFDGSEQVDAEVLSGFAARFAPHGFRPEALCPAYGLAEMGVGVAFSPIGRGPRVDTVDGAALREQRVAAVAAPGDRGATTVVGCGMPLPGYEIRVVDAGRRPLPERHEGEVECRGPSATPYYFANVEASNELWHDGWLDTGDLGYLADGELFLTGRSKDVIIRAGRNLYPEDLERSVAALEGVAPRGVAVFASATAPAGSPARARTAAAERLVVAVETDLTDDERRRRLQADVARRSAEVIGAVPDEVVLVGPGSLLRTASGKIRRSATRDAYESGRLGRPAPPPGVQLARFAASALRPAGARIGHYLESRVYAGYAWGAVAAVGAPLWFAISLPLSIAARWRLTRVAGHTLCRLVGDTIEVDGDVDGDGRLPTGSAGAIVVANHASYVDGLAMILASPDPLVPVVSTELERQPVVGSFLSRLGCVFVERGRSDQAGAAVDRLAGLVGAGARLLVFPEGGLQAAEGVGNLHLGAFAVAARTGCPVVPVGISGSRGVVRPASRLPHRASVRVRVGRPILPSGSAFADQVALRDEVRGALAELSGDSGGDRAHVVAS